MWGKEEVLILSERLWVVIRKEQDWYVAKEKKIRLLNGNELVSVLQLPGEVLSPFLPTEQSAHSFLLAYNYPSTEH